MKGSPVSENKPRDDRPRPLDRAECLALLRSVGVGRAAWTNEHGLVIVEPVNYAVTDDTGDPDGIGDGVLFRTAEGTRFDAVSRGAPFSFEADEVEPALRTGWSVLAHGTPRIVTDPADLERLGRMLPSPWDQSSPKPFLVIVRIEEGSGRRLPLSPGGVTFDDGDTP